MFFFSLDAVGGRKSASRKENGKSQVPEDSVALSIMPTDTKNKEVSSVVRYYTFHWLQIAILFHTSLKLTLFSDCKLLYYYFTLL